MAEKHLGLRIDSKLLNKFHCVCAYEGRSANSQILYLIKHCVLDFEKEHGTIAENWKEE